MYAQKIVLHFPPDLVDQPILYRLSKDFDLEFNILKAVVNPKEMGLMVLELKGARSEYNKAIDYLKKTKVRIQTLSKDISRDERKCVHCGLCVGTCPTKALELNLSTREVDFHEDRCIACGMCVRVCPYKAMEITLE